MQRVSRIGHVAVLVAVNVRRDVGPRAFEPYGTWARISGSRAVITDLAHLSTALTGDGGTVVVPVR